MEPPIPKWLKKIWDLWSLRGCIMGSFSLQAFLTISASFRQQSRSKILLGFIWLAYLLADLVATASLGLITKTQSETCRSEENENLLAFWASFILLHLGGPDSITSFALEDNEFWLRHLMTLVLQVLAAAYSFYLTLPENKLRLPTVLIFLVGTVKFVEKTFALYLASLDHFGEIVLPEPNPVRDYEEAVDVYSSMRSCQIPVRTKMTTSTNAGINVNVDGANSERFDELRLLKVAHEQFESFKGLIVGLILSSKERKSSRDLFLKRTAKEAFRIIEYELSFIYEVLHTKVIVVRGKVKYFIRFFCFLFITTATISFYLIEKKNIKLGKPAEIKITYGLLFGAMGLDMISILKLIFSKWTLISLNNSWTRCIVSVIRYRKWWSASISQYNMISYCLHEKQIWVFYKLAGYVQVRWILDKVKIFLFSSKETTSQELEDFIFEELRMKSSKTRNLKAAMEACDQRGDWALLETSSYMDLKWSVGEFQYSESLLLWHIATELCYKYKVKSNTNNDTDQSRKKICKLLSDYMFYLLVMQPTMMASVLGNWHIVFRDTCAEAKKFFDKHSISDHSRACDKIILVKTTYRPATVNGMSKSLLFDACRLAKQLRSLETDPWKLMSRVWVELLSYAAINCRPIVHAQQPGKGGELLTFTWLLMNHLGLGTQFYEQEQYAGTKIVAEK